MHLKMSSAEVICSKKLPNITDKIKYKSKQRGPRTDYSYIGVVWSGSTLFAIEAS